MRFNIHCHVFNLQAVFTSQTQHILEQRVREAGMSQGVAQLVVKALLGIMRHQERLDALRRLFDPHSRSDLLEFLDVATLPSMDDVTDWLLGQLAPDVVITPLMMDITLDGGGDALFQAQLEATRRQMDRHPGRVLPFVAVNPLRPDHFRFMEQALDAGFAGVKLYPSLGYSIDSEEIERVARRCAARGVPIMQHCSKGGFYAERECIDSSRPNHWQTYLEDIEGLRVCFGHFGGERDFVGDVDDGAPEWTAEIIGLMHAFPGKVYADVSYHTIGMGGGMGGNPPRYRTLYLNRLAAVLQDPGCRPYVLWGSDSFLVRQVVTEREYWEFFTSILSPEDFEQMASVNPRRYLGM